MKHEIIYKRELHLLEKKVQFGCAGVNEASTRNFVVNRIVKADGKLAVEVCAMIMWFDLTGRKVRVPPRELAAAMAASPRTEEYAVL